jgi:hypothetical protein
MNSPKHTVLQAAIFLLCAALPGPVLVAGTNTDPVNTSQARDGDLKRQFDNPPQSAKPWVYWYWMKGNVTREGITRDLQDMAAIGVGGAYLMPIGGAGKMANGDPSVKTLTDPWWEMVVFTTREADRLGLRIAMNACDGWALAGGPWIKPEMSMQEVTWTTTSLTGGKSCEQ